MSSTAGGGLIYIPRGMGGVGRGRVNILVDAAMNPSNVTVVTPDGREVSLNKSKFGRENGIKFYGPSATELPAGSQVLVDGQLAYTIQNPGIEAIGKVGQQGTFQLRNKGRNIAGGAPSSGGGYQGGDGSTVSPGGFATGPNGTAALPGLVDASGLMFGAVDIPFMDKVPYNRLNTMDELRKNGKFNRELYNELFEISRQRTKTLIDDDLQAIGYFATKTLEQQKQLSSEENRINRPELEQSNQFNKGMIAGANDFNQGELDRRIDSTMPQAREIVKEQLGRGRKLAAGTLPTSIEDRMFERAAESTAADLGMARGFGATSSFAQSAIDKYTIGERINLMDRGDALTDKWLQRGMQLLVDAPMKYNPLLQQPSLTGVSQDLKGTPPVVASSLTTTDAARQQAVEGMPASQMLATDIDQERYETNRETQRLTQNQAWKFAAQQFNTTGNWGMQIAKLQVDAANAASAYNAANNYAGLVNQGLGQSQNLAAQTTGQVAGQVTGSNSNPWSDALSLLSGVGSLISGRESGGASRAGGSYTQPMSEIKTAPTVQPTIPAPIREATTGQISI